MLRTGVWALPLRPPFFSLVAALLVWIALAFPVAAAPAAPEEASPPPTSDVRRPTSLSLEQAQRLALANHPSLRATRQSLRQAEIALWEAYFGLASLTGNFIVRQQFERTGIGSSTDGSSRTQSYQLEVRLGVPLYSGGLTSGRIGRAEAERLRQELNVATARLDVLRDVTAAYWESKRQEILYRVEEETLRQAEETYNFTRVRLQAGATAPIDFNRAEVNLINTRDGLTRAQGNLAAAKERLLAQLYSPLPDFFLSDEPTLTPESVTLEEALSRSRERRPETRSAQLEVQIRQQELVIAGAGLWPTLTLEAGYQLGNDTFTVLVGNPQRPLARTITGTPAASADLQVNLQYRFWDNGSTLRRIASARAAVAIADEQLAIARRQAEREVRQAHIALQTAAQRVQNLEKIVAIARDNLRIINLRYRLGAALIIELSDVQASLAQTLTNRANALIDYRIAQADLARAVGAEEWLLVGGQK